ncbi:3-deoxy-manno-octulosonate cytidylyltransferase [Mesorhizobium sp. M5C.F.Ca.IN.020.29.1.1]|uniref:3-deoxy-manno-octulosonate cytidylyltransferase n=1 Tax=Mesorhizobium sp. M5C.F.Ca.IN.020.29.1.1 TaxID=2496770 RepID=UPI000FCBC6A4|nr:3-deoxy-manno-octulosonate cytidylyltransferase [Mesorhizobium sp. M5C.F.Ca.IN.020.29.1.1]RUV46678.1 3-deoxy-manno-octulosonate cytidylyltransferase [Mesorhizobium sp. M5C.F.Ca.IN.020.29.1.1]
MEDRGFSLRPIVIIPTRLGSTRLPGKALTDINGEPMIAHVWRRGVEADIGPVVVACGDQQIADIVNDVGGRAVLTDPALPSGSDRAYAALCEVDPDEKHDVVVVLQGDLPTIDPATIEATLTPLARDAECEIATLATVIEDPLELHAPQVVKIALAVQPGDTIGRAVYFSRMVIPAGRGEHYHHIGMYTYRREALAKYVSLPRGILERRENLEQLRAIEYGMRIDATVIQTEPLGVDTLADLERARTLFARR